MQPNGELYVIGKHKEIDTEVVAAKLEEDYLRKLKAGRAKYTADQIPEMVRREILQIREHQLSLAETKAQLRVVRAILSLKQVYTAAELSRPFVIPRLLVRPDLTDPAQLEAARAWGHRATSELYGELPSSTALGSTSPDQSSEQAPEAIAYGEGAASEGATLGSSESSPVEVEAVGLDEASASGTEPERGEPKSDPIFEDGPYRGQHWSEVAQDNPDYLRGLASATRAKAKRELMEAWLRWYYPPLEGA